MDRSSNYGGYWTETLNKFKDLSLQFRIEVAKVSSNQGFSKAQLGQHSEAIKDYDTAIHLKPDNEQVHKDRELSLKKLSETHNS